MGDKNVYYIDVGKMIRDVCGDESMIDGCHPIDWGFSAMANVIGSLIKEILDK